MFCLLTHCCWDSCIVSTTQQFPTASCWFNEYQWKLGVNRHTTRCTSSVSVILWLWLVSGWGLRKRRSAPPYGLLRLGKGLYFTFTTCWFTMYSTVHATCCIAWLLPHWWLKRKVMLLKDAMQWYICNNSFLQNIDTKIESWSIHSFWRMWNILISEMLLC